MDETEEFMRSLIKLDGGGVAYKRNDHFYFEGWVHKPKVGDVYMIRIPREDYQAPYRRVRVMIRKSLNGGFWLVECKKTIN